MTVQDTAAPFLITTTYSVWVQIPGQRWRCWSNGFTEHHHAVEDQERLERGIQRGTISPRETRVARQTTVIEWVEGGAA